MKRTVIFFATVLIGIVIFGIVILFVYTNSAFPQLLGPYQVGKTKIDLVDSARKDILGVNSSNNRELAITIYYPAQPSSSMHTDPYASGKELAAAAKDAGVPAFILSSLLHPHTYTDAPISMHNKAYPVLLFSPGWGTPPLFYTSLLEQVASHGYIVAAISHTDSTDYTVFPDGRIVYATKAGSDPDKYATSDAQKYAIREQVGDVWMGDAADVLKKLTLMNTMDNRFKGRLNLQKVGMFGHSFGGAVAAQLAASDTQILAAINMDGEPITRNTKVILHKPFMMMSSDISDALLSQQKITRAQMKELVLEGDSAYKDVYFDPEPGYAYVLQGSTHTTYESDTALLSSAFPLFYSSDIRGTIQGKDAVLTNATFITDFFDQSLIVSTNKLIHIDAKTYPVYFGTYTNTLK